MFSADRLQLNFVLKKKQKQEHYCIFEGFFTCKKTGDIPFATLADTSISRSIETTDFVIIMTFSSPITMTMYGNISL